MVVVKGLGIGWNCSVGGTILAAIATSLQVAVVSSAFGVYAPGAERLLSFGLWLWASALPVELLLVPLYSFNILTCPETEFSSPQLNWFRRFDFTLTQPTF